MFIKNMLFFVLILIMLLFYLKHFEKRGIYYPIKEIELSPEAIGLRFEDIFFKTSDGLKLNGWFIPSEESKATLIFCHGNAGNIGHRLEIIEIFNRIGLNVFIFDYRGYGRSQGHPSEDGLYLDAQASYNYLLKRDNIDRDRIIVYGKSIGANVAIDLALKVKVTTLIPESGFTSALEMGKKLFPFFPVKWIISIKYDALSKIKNIYIPKLIIHSRDDEIIPFRFGQRLFEAAPQPKEFYQMRGTHNEAVLLAKEEFASRINAFLNKYLFQ